MVNSQGSMVNGEWAMGNDKAVISQESKHPAIIRFFAHLFSYLFHPLFIPIYVTWFLVFVHTTYFVGYGHGQKLFMLARMTLNMVFFPLITVLLLKGLGFIQSIFLRTQKDRIIPYMASGIFFFWAYLVFRKQPEVPSIMTVFTFAVFLSSSAALIANIYFKISMHAIGMGGVIGLFLVIMRQDNFLMTVPLSIAFLLTGIVCTSRMIVSDHTPKEIYTGLVMGIVCQLVAAVMYL
jgi:4TM region of DNA translocase FtsK/SpoIIIE